MNEKSLFQIQRTLTSANKIEFEYIFTYMHSKVQKYRYE